MKTRKGLFIGAILSAILILCVAGVKVSRLTRTQTFNSNSLFIVVTGETTKVTRHVQAHDLARGLGPWITNAGGSGGEVTTAQLNTASNALIVSSGRILYVRTNGTDATALVGDERRAWRNISNAVLTAISGDTIDVGPGTHWEPTNSMSLLKSNVNWIVPLGTSLAFGTTADAANPYPVFNDWGGPVRCTIFGGGNFWVSNQLSSVFHVTNALSEIKVSFNEIRQLGQVSAINHGEADQTFIGLGDITANYDAILTDGGGEPGPIFIDCRDILGGTTAGDSSIELGLACSNPGRAFIKARRARGDLTLFDNGVFEIATVELGSNQVIYSTTGSAPLGSGILRGATVYSTSNRTASLIQTPASGVYRTAGTFENCIFWGATNRATATITNSGSARITFKGCVFKDGWGGTNSITFQTTPQTVYLSDTELGHGLRSGITAGALTNHFHTIKTHGNLAVTGSGVFSNGLTIVAATEATGDLNVTGQLNASGTIIGADAGFSGEVTVADEAYAAGWNGDVSVPTKNALYDKIETLGSGSGGTNFPAVLSLAGNTNHTLQSGKRTKFLQATNLNHGLDVDLATPESGHTFTSIITNSAATNITVTFYTNGVAATFFSIEDMTNNATSWTVPAGGIVESEFTFMPGSYWLRKEVSAPAYRLVWGANITGTTNGVNGLDITVAGGSTDPTNAVLANLIGTVGNNVTNTTSTQLQITAGAIGLAPASVLEGLRVNAATTVTNENSTALQIDTGTLTLTPGGVLSNIVASGHGAPYIAVNTNGGTRVNITNLVFATPSVTLSNDSTGIASIHVAASGGAGGPSTNSPPQTLTLSGTGTTNIIVDMLALLSTNEVRCTLTARAAIIFTNVVDGKYVTVETIQDATGGWTISTNNAYPHNIRIGTTTTGFDVETNATWRNLHRFRGSGTNAQLVGYSLGFQP